MKNGKTEHFWRIHQKVMRRVWADLPDDTRDIIANDVDQDSEAFKWFESKVLADATRLYEDPDYFANDTCSFKYPVREMV
jgi:hypothetical protein